jgi:hypothetical protein
MLIVLIVLIGVECDRKHRFTASLCFQGLKNILNMNFKRKIQNFTRSEKKGTENIL